MGFVLTGALTVRGMPATQVALASLPNCQVWVTSRGSNNVTIIDGTTSDVSTIGIGDSSWNVTVAPDGAKAYIATNSSNIKVVDAAGSYSLSTISEPSFAVATSSDGTKLYSADWFTSSLKEINTVTGAATGRSALTQTNPGAIAVSPNGTNIYVANYNSSPATVTRIDTASFTATHHVVNAGWTHPSGVVVSPDGLKLYVVMYGANVVRELDTATMTVQRTVSVAGFSRDVVIDSSGSKIYVTSSAGNHVVEIDITTFSITATIPVGTSPQKLAISPDDRFLFVSNEGSNSVSKIDLSTDLVVDTIAVNAGPFGIAVGPSNCTTLAPTPPVTPAAVVTPETTVAPTTTLAPTTTIAPSTTVVSPLAVLPETGDDSDEWILIAVIAMVLGTVLAARRRQLSQI